MASFRDVVAVRRATPGRYAADLDASWNALRFPLGGLVTAVSLRAAQDTVADASQHLRTCTTVFAAPVASGPVELTVQVLRRGRSATQVAVTACSPGSAEGATTVAVFGSSRRGPSFVDVAPPDVPDPAQCSSYRDPPPPGVAEFDFAPFWRQVEGRPALGHAPWQDYEPSVSDVATWLRFDDPPRLDDGQLDPLAVVAVADRMLTAVSERTGFAGPAWLAPSADLTVHLFAPLRTDWMLAHDRARWADDGWAELESRIWDERRRLIACATQMVFFTYV